MTNCFEFHNQLVYINLTAFHGKRRETILNMERGRERAWERSGSHNYFGTTNEYYCIAEKIIAYTTLPSISGQLHFGNQAALIWKLSLQAISAPEVEMDDTQGNQYRRLPSLWPSSIIARPSYKTNRLTWDYWSDYTYNVWGWKRIGS